MHILFSEASDNFKAYGVAGHRHRPEIRQGLSLAADREMGLTFAPHLTPTIRGIHATLYARLVKDADVQQLFEREQAVQKMNIMFGLPETAGLESLARLP
jgi:N-acetyl-gamma-glutamyl-phosphate reductase